MNKNKTIYPLIILPIKSKNFHGNVINPGDVKKPCGFYHGSQNWESLNIATNTRGIPEDFYRYQMFYPYQYLGLIPEVFWYRVNTKNARNLTLHINSHLTPNISNNCYDHEDENPDQK